MRILLTGGSGFIGMNLASFLKKKGIEVVCIGRHACPLQGVQNILIPCLTAKNIDEALKANQIKIDALFHLAAAGVHPQDRNFTTLMNVNTLLPANIVKLGEKYGIKAMVMTGSSSEYQNISVNKPLVETVPLQTGQIYGATKAAGGLCALSQGIALQIPVAWIRLFNVYGSGEATYRLFPSILSHLLAGKKVALSVGIQMRDFVYIEDVCEGLWVTLNALLLGQMPTSAYNLCTGMAHSVKEFAMTMACCLKKDENLLDFGALPLREDDKLHVVGDPTLLENVSGWKASYTLEQGIEHAIALSQLTNKSELKCH